MQRNGGERRLWSPQGIPAGARPIRMPNWRIWSGAISRKRSVKEARYANVYKTPKGKRPCHTYKTRCHTWRFLFTNTTNTEKADKPREASRCIKQLDWKKPKKYRPARIFEKTYWLQRDRLERPRRFKAVFGKSRFKRCDQ